MESTSSSQVNLIIGNGWRIRKLSYMKGIFGGLFDFNHDGKMNAFESAVELAVLDDMLKEDEAETDFEMSGLDADERREALEDAGLDPDDYDF